VASTPAVGSVSAAVLRFHELSRSAWPWIALFFHFDLTALVGLSLIFSGFLVREVAHPDQSLTTVRPGSALAGWA